MPGGEDSYGLENITPTMMSLVDRATERKAIDNRIDNRKNLVDAYVCPECDETFTTVAVHAGEVPFFADCGTIGCGGDARCTTAGSRSHVDDYEGSIDYEWYRPLTEEECAVAVSLLGTESSTRAAGLGVSDEDAAGGMREFFAGLGEEEGVRDLLEGRLLRRPRTG